MRRLFCIVVIVFVLPACEGDETVRPFELNRVFVGDTQISLDAPMTTGLPTDRSLSLVFSAPVDAATVGDHSILMATESGQQVDLSFSVTGATVVIFPAAGLTSNTIYTVTLTSQLRGADNEAFEAREITFKTALERLTVVSMEINGSDVGQANRITDVPLTLDLTLHFSVPVDVATASEAITLSGSGTSTLSFSWSNENRDLLIKTTTPLRHLSRFEFEIDDALKGSQGEDFTSIEKQIYTGVSDTPQFPVISDEALLTLVQQQTFKYFWDFAQPASGMARERNTSGDLVTSGGSGFGIMSLIVGIERNFITRSEGLERMDKILDFLESADRFHGVWSHWIDGNNGNVIPFSTNDNGGDLVETSFLVQGLLTFRQYLNAGVPAENTLINRINTLWESVEWDWYTRGGENVLYWHWSPDKEWTMNHKIQGYNEALITYVLAASSPTHTIDADVYHEGWARNGAIVSGKNFYGIKLPLGFDFGGPLFFAHYSFLGLDPRNLSDTYGNYWEQNVNHTLINHAYAVANPKKFVGYSDENWGLTASDNHLGYSAHSPTNDLGVISPTAAVSSLPYAPEESMKAIRFFYYKAGDRLWGEYGFYDAYTLTEGWTASSYLAIDQGPMIIMIENYRTGLLWELFMSAPEVQSGLIKLGFNY